MELRINRECDVPVRDQIVEQVVYLILTAQRKPGQPMPSVRELGRQLQVHHNTVSEAYQELVRRKWLEGRRGTRLTVRPAAETGEPLNTDDLDDFINATLALARRLGFSDQALRERVRERLLAEPPDHLLVVEQAPGLRQLLVAEVRSATRRRVESCSLDDLRNDHGICIGALAVATPYALEDVNACLSKTRQAVSITFASAKEHLDRIRRLEEPSMITVVSISQTFLPRPFWLPRSVRATAWRCSASRSKASKHSEEPIWSSATRLPSPPSITRGGSTTSSSPGSRSILSKAQWSPTKNSWRSLPWPGKVLCRAKSPGRCGIGRADFRLERAVGIFPLQTNID